ncbi:MAG: CARDB domain-containing protein [Solirubrobacteraceae bacterium]
MGIFKRSRIGGVTLTTIALTGVLPYFASASPHLGPHHAPHPNLVVRAIAGPAGSVVPGQRFVVRDTTANTGKAPAGASVTAYYLARTAKHQRSDVRVGDRPVKRLLAGAHSNGSATVTVPIRTALGSYRIIACADDRNQVKETNEHDNCRATSTPLHVIVPPDTTPPTFGGLGSASATSEGSVLLSWSPGVDNRTPAIALVYDVYMASSPGGESYAAPTATTSPGVTSFTVSGLSPATTYYFVVLARDQAGNQSSAKVERFVTTLPSTPPPTFAGLQGYTFMGTGCGAFMMNPTCHVHLFWNAASDQSTPASAIIYDIYVSSTRGHEDYSMPGFTTAPGATSFDLPAETDMAACFVVRARNGMGNEDQNTVELCAAPPP